MSKLLDALHARLAEGPIPVAELLAVQKLAGETADLLAHKAVSAEIRDCWGTPPELFDVLHQRYTFDVDIAAEPWNAKLPRWWGVGGELHNAFSGSLAGLTWFCNPPFSQIEKWLTWIWSFYDPSKPRAGSGVLVLPATRTEQRAWQQLVEPFRDKPEVWETIRCEFRCVMLPGRTHYVPPPGIAESSPRFGSCVLQWNPLP